MDPTGHVRSCFDVCGSEIDQKALARQIGVENANKARAEATRKAKVAGYVDHYTTGCSPAARRKLGPDATGNQCLDHDGSLSALVRFGAAAQATIAAVGMVPLAGEIVDAASGLASLLTGTWRARASPPPR